MPKYGSLDLQTDNIYTEEITFKSMADRQISLSKITKRPGSKFVASEFDTKQINIRGKIVTATASGLNGIIDEMHRVLGLEEQVLTLEDGRSYTATCTRANIEDANYTQSKASFDLDFVSSLPYSRGSSRGATFEIESGTESKTIDTYISGTFLNEPTVTLTASGEAGDSGIKGYTLNHTTGGSETTISGTTDFSRSVSASFNYGEGLVTVSGQNYDYTGNWSRWDIGDNTLEITVSGTNDHGINGQIQYNPRYFK